MRRLSVSASNLGQLDDACAHVGSSARKETKTETKPDPKMLSGSARGDHQRLFQQHRPVADIEKTEIPQCSVRQQWTWFHAPLGLLPHPWRAIPWMSAPTGFRTFQDFPKDLASRSVAR